MLDKFSKIPRSNILKKGQIFQIWPQKGQADNPDSQSLGLPGAFYLKKRSNSVLKKAKFFSFLNKLFGKNFQPLKIVLGF